MGVNRLMRMLCYLAFKRHGIDDHVDEGGRQRFEIHTSSPLPCFIMLRFDVPYFRGRQEMVWRNRDVLANSQTAES
jgi:hypothetical protein